MRGWFNFLSNICNQQQCLTDKTKYWNSTAWVSWTANCAIWNDAKWASCSQGYYNKRGLGWFIYYYYI